MNTKNREALNNTATVLLRDAPRCVRFIARASIIGGAWLAATLWMDVAPAADVTPDSHAATAPAAEGQTVGAAPDGAPSATKPLSHGAAVIGAEGFDPLKSQMPKVQCDWGKQNPVSVKVRYVNSDDLFDTGAYSAAVIVPSGAKLVLISGQIPIGTEFQLEGQDLFQQTQSVLKNLCSAMRAAGVSGDDIIKLGVTYVHQDQSDPYVISEQLNSFLGRQHMPATTMTGVNFIIAKGIRVQVDAMAIAK